MNAYGYNGIIWIMRDGHDIEEIGFVPTFFDVLDTRPAAEQVDDRYAHGGGWSPNPKWEFDRVDHTIHYPGDKPLNSIAVAVLAKETVIMFEHSFMLIFNREKKTFEVARVD